MSALQIIVGTSDRYTIILSEIKKIILEFLLEKEIILHWVKSHVGSVGNEIADKSANEGHHINCTVRFGKSTHISIISNSVTHLRSYTNSAIADIARNSAPISPVTPLDSRRLRIERRRFRIERRRPRIER